MKHCLKLLALCLTLLTTAAYGQSIKIHNLSDGDILDFEDIQFNVRVEGIPNYAVQSRIHIDVWQESSYLAWTWNNCQIGDGTYRYDAFRIEMLNHNKLGDSWCLEKQKVTVAAKLLDLSEFPSGTQLRIIAKLEWADNGWNEVTDSIYVYAQ